MSIGLSLFATGIVALCCGVSAINNEPQQLAPQSAWVNNGIWYEFSNNSLVQNATQYDSYSLMFSYNFYSIDDTGINYKGSYSMYNVSLTNNDDYFDLYFNLPNYNGLNTTNLVCRFSQSTYNQYMMFVYSNTLLETDYDSRLFVIKSFDYLDSLSDWVSDNIISGNDSFVQSWFAIVDTVSTNMVYCTYDILGNGGSFVAFDSHSDNIPINYEFNWFTSQYSTYPNPTTYQRTFYYYSNVLVSFTDFNDEYSVPTDELLYYYVDEHQTVKSDYNFSTSDEIPFNSDYLDSDINEIYSRYKLTFTTFNEIKYIHGGSFSLMNNGGIYITRVRNYTETYSQGYNEGYQIGYRDGNNVGYENGYRNGVNDTYATDNSFFHLFGAIADTPILMLRSLFDFDLFGINVLVAVLSLLTAIITAWVIRKFI